MPDSARQPAYHTRDIQAQLIQPTLHVQRWSLDAGASARQSRIVHLSSGRAELLHGEGQMAMRAHDIVWLPAGMGRAWRVEAGSQGMIVGVSEVMLATAIGHHADSVSLRQLTAGLAHLTALESRSRGELTRSLLAVELESRRSNGGSWHYLAAHLTIVLVLMRRLGSSELPSTAMASAGARRLRRFRHLVEAQFRQHWPMARYAQEMAITPDRLHHLCVRHLQRTPSALVHQRLAHEASVLLAGSDQAIERLANDLGFASASHFSRFFKRWQGLGPKAYREQLRALAAAGQTAAPNSYADWP